MEKEKAILMADTDQAKFSMEKAQRQIRTWKGT